MKKLIFYSYLKCSTFPKVKKWLDQKNLRVQLIDIIKEPPLLKYLNLALEKYSLGKKMITNTRGKVFKSINFDIHTLSREEIIQFLLGDGKLIKRPFMVCEEKKVILGFNEIEYAKKFL